MIILLDTSGPICKMSFIYDETRKDVEWQSGRDLAKGLLAYINDRLNECDKTWNDISAIGVFEGPGSFTGLRIGLTVMNTIANAQQIPIVGGRGDDWQSHVIQKLQSGFDEKIILPFYGSDAKITTPKK
jgi:tRNA threonylcarbamoyladenosine biosynthesis protein TsaB